MIKSIRLQNFFSFKDCTINLNPGANVLVGINGSGKSNFFKAIELFKAGALRQNHEELINNWNGLQNMIYQNALKGNFLKIESEFDVRSIPLKHSILYSKQYSQFIDKTSRITWGEICEFGNIDIANENSTIDEEFDIHQPKDGYFAVDSSSIRFAQAYLKNQYENTFVYNGFNLSDVSEASSFGGDKVLKSSGENLPHLLNYLNTIDKSAFSQIEEAMRKVNENFIKIDLVPFLDKLTFGITEKNFNKTVLAYNLSDGTLRFLCLMAILYNPSRGSVVCIEEPELGLHPDMINTLYRAIKHASETSQVIISTHSDHLLNYFNLDEVRVFEKDEENATVVEQFSEDDFKGWKDNFLVGKMWRSGTIGGNRW